MRLYKFKSHPEYNLYACRSKNDQYLLGFLKTDFLMIKFSPEGVFQEVTKEGKSDPVEFNVQQSMITEWISRYQLQIGTIEVEKFGLPSYRIRITDIPVELEDYIENKADYSDEEKTENERQIDLWQSGKDYVFVWSNVDFWVNQEGEIKAT